MMRYLGPNGRTILENYESTMERIRKLKNHLSEVEVVWECRVDEQIKENPQMKEFFEDVNVKGRIEPRDAYFGGRTGPLALHAQSTKKKTISYYDIISLYPSVNYYTEYPIGVPKIIYPEITTRVNWTKKEHIQYNDLEIKGLLKVHIIPPKKLYIPVIPIRLPGDQRLLFMNCAKCSKKFEKKNTRTDWKCPHSDKQRSFTTTVTSIELAEALEQGYKVDRFYRAWHYKKWDDNLFKGYVRLFLKLKIESSGFPDNVKTDEQKRQWAQDYKDRFDISIDLDNVNLNTGLRHISKLCLNSLWGKFSQRNCLSKNVVVTKPTEYYEYLFNPKYEVVSITGVSEEALRLVYRDKDEYVEEHKCSNIVLSLWTTSAARLALYQFMKKVLNTKGCRLLYTDTDSIIVEHPIDLKPIMEGEFLGDMSREHVGYKIIEYICGGAKAYALKLLPEDIDVKDAKKSDYLYVLKLRGITLDSSNCEHFQYNNFRDMVLRFGDDAAHHLKYTKIGPTKDSRLHSTEMKKNILVFIRKESFPKI